jgi:hypothetical protein
MPSNTAPPTTVTLDDKYTARHGRVLLSGIQALVRMILDNGGSTPPAAWTPVPS